MRSFLLVLLLLVPLSLAFAQDKKQKGKDQARIILALPFGVVPGKTTRVALRGLKLDSAKEVKIAKGSVKLLKKSKVPVPQQQEAGRVGDSQVDVEVTLPADITGEHVELTVVHPDGDVTRQLLIDKTPPIAEKEPNDGFKQAQAIKIGQTIDGGISRAQDVDVFRFEAKGGDKVVIEVLAQRLGSALNSFVTVYDGDGQVVATGDDTEGSTDSRLELTPKAGSYFISLSDAHDQGGPAHPYRLVVRAR
jgi:hypothetical protein